MGEQDAYLQLPGKGCLLARPSSVSVRSSPRSGRLLLLPSMSRYAPLHRSACTMSVRRSEAMRSCGVQSWEVDADLMGTRKSGNS